jgi:hypothetical protein
MNYLYPGVLMLGALILSRFAELPANFTPILAAAVVAPYLTTNRWAQWCLPVAALFITDMVLGFYSAAPVVYAMVMFASILGTHVKNMYVAGVGSVFAWHVVVNGAVWYYGTGTVTLLQTYLMAIPFDFRLLCATILFVAIFDVTRRTFYAIEPFGENRT